MSDIRRTLPIRIDSSRHFFVEADSASFGEIFAYANSEQQVAILTAMMESLKSSWSPVDYIAMELAKEVNDDVRKWLIYLTSPGAE